MSLPFTTDQFFDVFARYNRGVWPAQIVLYALAVILVIVILRTPGRAGRFAGAVLALFWTWMAVVYHFSYFSAVNPAALIFGAFFLAGAAGFAWSGLVKARLRFGSDSSALTSLAYALWLYALIGYPLVGYLAGHHYPAMPTFGVPCPTTIFTIGVLLLVSPAPRLLFIVPILWSALGMFAALRLGVPQDFGLFAAGAAGIWACLRRPMPDVSAPVSR